LKPDLTPQQIETIQSILDPLLADLDRRANALPPHAASSLVYELECEQPAQEAGE
jgi:hypothetical protein